MKIGTDMKYNYLLLALATVALFSCSRKEVEDPNGKGELVTIRAYQEGATETRTTLIDGGTQVYWEPSDEIKVFLNGVGSRFTSTAQTFEGVSTFTGSLNALIGVNEGFSDSSTLWGLYPYRADATSDGMSVSTTLPDNQTGRAGSFAKNTNITIAHSEGFDLAFYNVCGGIRFSLTQEGVKEVIFEGQNNEDIAGKVKIAFADGVPAIQQVVEGQKTITLSALYGQTLETGKWYYIVALPGTLSGGFKMTFNTDTQYATLKSSGSKTIKRGIFGSLADADEDLIYKDKGGGDEPGQGTEAEAVDLGLSVKWATFNVGATKPEEFGDYFAWGETETKNEYRTENYKFAHIVVTGGDDGSGFVSPITSKTTFDKYVPKSRAEQYGYNGFYDDKTILDPDDDVAHVIWGGGWRMPTWSEFSELINNCTWTKGAYKGVNGYKVTSKKDGYTSKWIFLPAAGYRSYTSLSGGTTYCYYLASSLYESQPDYAWGISYQSSKYTSCPRWYGVPVRPVCE